MLKILTKKKFCKRSIDLKDLLLTIHMVDSVFLGDKILLGYNNTLDIPSLKYTRTVLGNANLKVFNHLLSFVRISNELNYSNKHFLQRSFKFYS